jgi:hypothetical protein
LEKVVNQDNLLNAGGTKKKATALLAGHGISLPAFKPKGSKKGKQKKRCATKDCKFFVKVHFHKFCDACFSSRKEKSSADDSSALDDSALDDVPAAVREKNHARKLKSLKKKMAQMSSVKNKSKREELLHEANALLASFGDAVNKKNKKNKIEDEEGQEAGLAELPVDAHATSDMPISSPKPKPKKKKTAQDDKLDRKLARCTVQRFAGCSVPSNFTL